MSEHRLLLCAALEHTLLPLGDAPEDLRARPLFRTLAGRRKIGLAYVSGRPLSDALVACAAFQLPQPDYLISEGGLAIHERLLGRYAPWGRWLDELAGDFAGGDHASMDALFANLSPLRPAPSRRPSPLKFSYAHPLALQTTSIDLDMQRLLEERGVRARLVCRIDGASREGRIDVLPVRATRLDAVDFLRRSLGYELDETLYAGSGYCGDDIRALAGPIPSVLVANAGDNVREVARHLAERNGTSARLYCATGGGPEGFDGNFAAGVIEGLFAHHPTLREPVAG